MIRAALVLVLSIPFAYNWCGAISAHAADPVRLRVLTYNIHHGAGVDRKLDLNRIAAVIGQTDPDIVALQEVDQGVARSNRVDQPAELARLTGLNVVFGDNISFGGGKYGNAVLSRFTIVDHVNHRLPNVRNGEQRGVIEATIQVPRLSEPIVLFATHLDHRSDDEERLKSARAINVLAAKRTGQSCLLAGDLNDVAGSRTLNEFTKMWHPIQDKPLLTVPVTTPAKQIDFVLYRPADQWQVVEARVLPEAVASDHRAVFCVLQLQSAPSDRN